MAQDISHIPHIQCPECGGQIGGYISLSRFAKLMDIGYSYAHRLARKGHFPVEQVNGTKALRVPVATLQECLRRKYGDDEVHWKPEKDSD